MAIVDIKAAVIEQLLGKPAITALTNKIGGAYRKVYGSNAGYVIVMRLNGTPGEDVWYEVGFQTTRLDMEFYGDTPEKATLLWRTVHSELCPVQNTGLHGFKKQGCRVATVEKESGPLELIDPVTELPFTFAAYVFTWAEVSVA